MAEKTGNGKVKRTSRGMRKHMRRVKQESGKAGTPISEWKKKVRIQPIAKKKGVQGLMWLQSTLAEHLSKAD